MSTLRHILMAALTVLAGTSANVSQAGDGFPPFGAWAYGSGGASGQHAHHHGHHGWGGHHRGGFGNYGFGYRGMRGGLYGSSYSYARYYSSGFGLGYSTFSYPRSYVGLSTRPVYRPYSANFWCGYPSYYQAWSSPVYYPRVVIPAPVYYPTQYYPIQYTPVCDAPVYWGTTYSNAAYSNAAYSNATAQLPVQITSSRYVSPAQHSVSKPLIMASGPLPPQLPAGPEGRLVSLSPSVDEAIPVEILDAADNICRAGGYREAATAYAQLSVRYGANGLLFGRRFVAQVASGDLEQAAVITASADLAGLRLRQEDLPEASLAGLGLDDSFVTAKTEALAAHALHKPEDAESLVALGSWLHLAGDHERGQLFINRAAQLAARDRQIESMRSSTSELVSLD